MGKENPRSLARRRRQSRVRKTVRGTASCPRLCVFRSAVHIYAQIIDDASGVTLAAASTLTPGVKERLAGLKKIQQAAEVGKELARTAKDKGLEKVVFDRNGFLYHGRVKALSEGAREAGLKF
ncbi:MAG: 50S ribosomal protein L18 [Deltaproteobacteria bacterium]|jgi:large subunit ribosomal protein L18|nr:50S ribosomal protein L18 [Deltaproteobacteria bacterium]